jgi:hypothetical protein
MARPGDARYSLRVSLSSLTLLVSLADLIDQSACANFLAYEGALASHDVSVLPTALWESLEPRERY